jgi:hypothetical protein
VLAQAITARPLVSTGDENASCAPAFLKQGSSAMRRRIQQAPLSERLTEEARRLRNEAQGIPAGIERERLIRRARQAETAFRINEWISSPGLRAPA